MKKHVITVNQLTGRELSEITGRKLPVSVGFGLEMQNESGEFVHPHIVEKKLEIRDGKLWINLEGKAREVTPIRYRFESDSYLVFELRGPVLPALDF